ncbi:MAG: decaprenyl-phosphate phosphoribosyltransferase [Planctomycetes bacterium]|nr:decaprenyl-phosphate phosphoribosyltransferase [Planctomycetota bacterium]
MTGTTVAQKATVGDYVELLRPTQWVKNVVVFAGPAAGLKLVAGQSFFQAFVAFTAFCLAASATYAINDTVDREADARHPTKRSRPVARGAIKPAMALTIGGLLIVLATVLSAAALNRSVAIVIGLYFLMTLAYSLVLKRLIILDVIVIASGFVLRAWGGSLAVGVATSEWLVACMFTLCLFMGFGKRRCEVAMIGNSAEAGRHRRTLIEYTPDLLNHLITVSAGIAVVTFLLYTMDATRIPAPFHKEHLFYTLPLVVYGIFRFAMLTELGIYSGPTEIVLKDRAFLAAVFLWAIAALVVVYQTQLFGPRGLEGLFSGMGGP